MSGAVLRNIESGTKSDLAVSELLNIARALTVSPIYLLAPIRDPGAPLDLSNLSDMFSQMTALEFDSWLSGTSDSVDDWTTPEDLSERSQLRAMRELDRLVAERDRLNRLANLVPELQRDQSELSLDDERSRFRAQKTDADRQIGRLSHYLRTAGWNVERWS